MAVLLVIGVVVGFYTLNNYIYKEKQGGPPNYEPYRGTLTGEYICLPHKDTAGPRTDECAFGIKLDDGSYYVADFNQVSQDVPQLRIGDRFTATGVITPIERLSSDFFRIYPVTGIFSVTDSVQIFSM